jgi:hypothetical protein
MNRKAAETTDNDPFDPDKLKLSPEESEALHRAERKATAQQEAAYRGAANEPFVMIPLDRYMQLQGAASSVIWLAGYLYYLSFKAHGHPFQLGNIALRRNGGMSRNTKLRALRELERMGWISLLTVPRKSPWITLVEDGGEN